MFPDMFEIFQEKEEEKSRAAIAGAAADERTFVLSIGGSLLIDEKPNTQFIAKFAEAINNLIGEGFKFAIVVGGGKTARDYIASAKALGANNFTLDAIAIAVTRINAMLLLQAIGNAYPKVLNDVSKAKEIIEQGRTAIYAGITPGFTTDSVAALVAENLGATFINLTNVDGVYSADPEKNSRAKFYDSLTYEKLIEIIQKVEAKPGQNVIIDLPACLILRRSRIRTFFLNGNDLENFESCIKGHEFKGTIVEESEEFGEEDVEEA